MTAAVSARNDNRVQCQHCSYSAEPGASIAGHVAMAHPEVPMDAIAPKRRAPKLSVIPTAAAAEIPAAPAGGAWLVEIPLDLVDVGDNVRVTLEAIDELAASIAEHGVLQPVKASLQPDGRYRLLWGQRRVLASRKAGLATIPAILADDPDDRPIEQLVENLHRADLNPIDRAEAMRKVVDAGVSQADLARKLGIAPSTVSNDLRILTLDEKVVDLVRKGEVSGSHAKAMVSLSASHQRDLASRIVATKLTSHQVEQELSWRRADTASKEAAAARTEKAIPKLLAALEADVPKTTAVALRAPYNMDREALGKAVKKAGWESTTAYARERPAKGKCDCAVVTIEFNRKWTIAPACTNDKHQDRARNLEHLEDNAWREAIAAKVEDLASRILATLTAAHAANLLPVPVLVLIAGDRFEIPELVVGAGDEDRSQLLKMVADRLASRADASRMWGQHRAPAEKALDELLAMLPPVAS